MFSTFFPDLQARGLFHQMTDPTLPDVLAKGPVTAYAGFDPTASSLHVGSLLPLMGLARLQRAGHSPIAVMGGGTGMIGDPSGRSSERNLLDAAQIEANLAGIRPQVERILDFGGANPARMVNNLDWLGTLDLIGFLRDIGKHFSVNAMIQRDSVQLRLNAREQGISYTEFSYALLQAYDFLVLHDRFGCTLQIGGSDQWGNITDGKELIRRLRGAEAYGLTMPLVTKADGTKFGKSESGNVWLDAERTTPFAFYQYWLNADDADVVRYLNFFTFLDRARIDALAEAVRTEPQKREAQRVLATEVTRMMHGDDALARAEKATAVLFGGGDLRELDARTISDAFSGSPRSTLSRGVLGTPDGGLVAQLAATGLSPSKAKAREAVQQGAVAVNNEPAKELDRVLATTDLLAGRYIVLRRGKKTYHVLEVTD